MNKAFQKIYCQLLLQQQIISKANNVTLITQWNIGDAWDQLKEYIGFGPSEAQKAAKAAEEAAKNDPNKKIQKLAVQITDEDMNKAKALISKNPTLIKHYNNLPTVEDQKAFIVGLLAQQKAKQAEQEANTFNPEKLDEKTKKLYQLCVAFQDKQWADENWLKAVQRKKVICIGEGGKPVAIAKSKFENNPDRYIEKSEANMPQDEFEKESVEEIIAKEENKDDLTKMLDIYVSAVGDEKKAKADFAKYLAKGKVVVFKNGKNAPVSKEKFAADSEKYIKLAQKFNPNAEGDMDEAQIDAKDIQEYKDALKKVLTAEPFKYSQKKLDRLLRKAEKEKTMLVFKEVGAEGEEKKEDKEEKEDKLISESFLTSIMEKMQKVLADTPAGKKYQVAEVDLKDFAAKQEEYIGIVEKMEEDLQAKADAKAKDEADAKANKQKLAKLKIEAKKLFDELPSAKLAKAADGDGDNELKPPKMELKSISGKTLATWPGDKELDNDEDIEAFRNFLNSGMDETDPGDPGSLAECLKATLDSGDDNKVNWSKMGECKLFYQEWISKARSLAENFKD